MSDRDADESGPRDLPHQDDPEADLSPAPEEVDPDDVGPAPPSPPELGGATGGADSEVVGLFVKLVVLFNVAVAALAIGVMLVYFEGRSTLGLQVTGLGVVAFGYGVARYYAFRRGRGGRGVDGVNDGDRDAGDDRVERNG